MGDNVTQTHGRPDNPELTVKVGRSLSSKLLWLTILFVMLAEVLIFVPSVANFRMTWLQERLNTAGAASVLISNETSEDLSRSIQDEVLMATGAKAIALRSDGVSKLVVVSEMPPKVDKMVNVDTFTPLTAIMQAFDTLIFGGDETLRVVGAIGDSDTIIEMVMPDEKLRGAMLNYARNVAIISLIISLFTAVLVFVAINRMMIMPIRNMTASMLEFAQDPSSPSAVIPDSDRSDEIGIANRELAAMQNQLQSTLRSQKRLADLGLAVSKINHDMRNILASAQLMSDALSNVDDPAVKRFAPKIIRTLDRAVDYTNDVLSYGKAQEKLPDRRRILLESVVSEVRDNLGLTAHDKIVCSTNIPADLEVEADPEQLFRVLNNLCRNAVQAMRDDEVPETVKRLSISAARMGTMVLIGIEDTGPGLPQTARENLFSAFKGSARHGGTGLGLAIAHELITAHGGTIELRDDRSVGTHFEIRLPDSPVDLASSRDRAGTPEPLEQRGSAK